MTNFYNDSSLVVFSPFDEPSGVPWFKNIAPFALNNPSGLSFDWLPHIVNNDDAAPRAMHPGTTTVFNPESGTVYAGYQVRGGTTLGTSDLDQKCLILGHGSFANRKILSYPSVAQSGFTVGFWAYPNSNGPDTLLAANLFADHARHCALILKGDDDDTLLIGISGNMAQGAQFGMSQTNPRRLSAYAAVNEDAAAAAPNMVSTPIESGVYTHVTFTYRYIDGTANQIALYRNGRLASSGVTTADLTYLGTGSAAYYDRVVSIGGAQIDISPPANRIEEAGGWGHLISGVYMFERVLHEGEVAAIHNNGGIHAINATFPNMTPVTLADDSIINYTPFISPGFIDVSRYHNNWFTESNEQQETVWVVCPGPFGRGMVFNDSSASASSALLAGSGISEQLFNSNRNGSFTVGGHFYIDGVSSYLNNILISWGSIGTAVDTPARSSAGFVITARQLTDGVRINASLYRDGLVATDGSRTVNLSHADGNMWTSLLTHVALAYDAQTNGTALYVGGRLAESGTLNWDLDYVVSNLAGSGYPLAIMNGIIAEGLENLTTGLNATTAGDDCAAGNLFVANRPMLPAEINYLANSGIALDTLFYGPHDPRIMGYWKGTEERKNDFIIRDRAGNWRGVDATPGHMVRVLSDNRWNSLASDASSKGQQLSYDQFSNTTTTTGGFTSGTWSIFGGSDGLHEISTSPERRSASASFVSRFMSVERDVDAPSIIGETLWLFDVTPSGSIPSVFGTNAEQTWNSRLITFGDANDRLSAYLTTANAPAGSGVTVVWMGTDATLNRPLCSGNVPYGATSKVLLRARIINPGANDANTTELMEFSVYINGVKVPDVTSPSVQNSFFTSDGAFGSTNDWMLSIGGDPVSDTATTHKAINDGLGEIRLKDIAILLGKFSQNDINELAISGVRDDRVPVGYSSDISMTTVFTDDTDLQGYWLFSGPDAGSGITDYSDKSHNLTHISRQALNAGLFTNADNSASNVRYIPLGFLQSPIETQASGITFLGNEPGVNQVMTPFAVSGVAFDIPNSGFTVGMWVCTREAIAGADDFVPLMSYGPIPNTGTLTTFQDSSWCIFYDELEGIRMILSGDGFMYLDPSANAARANQVNVGIHRAHGAIRDPLGVPVHKRGGVFQPAHIDGWQHVLFSYDHNNSSSNGQKGIITAYLNGESVDKQFVQPSGFHVPRIPENKLISFLIAPTAPWTWPSALNDPDPGNVIIATPFYMSRAVTDAEARYIAMLGFSPPTGTLTSGVMGGFMEGIDSTNGNCGGFMDGLDTTSGVCGGFMDGAFFTSGIMGGYIEVAESTTISGIMGGYMRGFDITSGICGGYMQGADSATGNCGGLMFGSVSGIERFDGIYTTSIISSNSFNSQIQLYRTNFNEFNAQIRLVEAIQPPDCAIIIPAIDVSGVNTPLNQYFIGSGQAIPPKTIVKAEWYFGDMNGHHTSSVSGLNGDLYPISHVFSQSGFYLVAFKITDSDGIVCSHSRIINLASGVAPVWITLSGVPRQGVAPLEVQFNQVYEQIPPGVSIDASLLDYMDGQYSVALNRRHAYNTPGNYVAIWTIKDSRNLYWNDGLNFGIDLLGTS
jgi:concanavalin A-like lectin/glucanase superfamily protein